VQVGKLSFKTLVYKKLVVKFRTNFSNLCFRALQLPPEAWLRMSLHNGSMTFITIRPNGRVGVRAIGECGYMDPAKLSTT